VTAPNVNVSNWMSVPDHWPGQIDLLTRAQNMGPATATILVLGGIVYLMWGVQYYKWLMTLNAALMGAFAGLCIGMKTDAQLVGAVVGGFAAAAITWPLMKYAVAIMGGLFGVALGASVWRLTNLDPKFAWAGGLTGLVTLGMLSFIIFRGSIIMFMSLQGAVMLVFGVLGLCFKYQNIAGSIHTSMSAKPFLLPIVIFVPMLCGFIYQQTRGGPATAGGKKE
jgi:hypothetical protein